MSKHLYTEAEIALALIVRQAEKYRDLTNRPDSTRIAYLARIARRALGFPSCATLDDMLHDMEQYDVYAAYVDEKPACLGGLR